MRGSNVVLMSGGRWFRCWLYFLVNGRHETTSFLLTRISFWVHVQILVFALVNGSTFVAARSPCTLFHVEWTGGIECVSSGTEWTLLMGERMWNGGGAVVLMGFVRRSRQPVHQINLWVVIQFTTPHQIIPIVPRCWHPTRAYSTMLVSLCSLRLYTTEEVKWTKCNVSQFYFGVWMRGHFYPLSLRSFFPCEVSNRSSVLGTGILAIWSIQWMYRDGT